MGRQCCCARPTNWTAFKIEKAERREEHRVEGGTGKAPRWKYTLGEGKGKDRTTACSKLKRKNYGPQGEWVMAKSGKRGGNEVGGGTWAYLSRTSFS